MRERRPLSPAVPTVLLVHALTGDARAGGPDGWWEPLIGPGRVLDPRHVRLLCFNLLGSCYGSSGPVDADFPRAPDGTPARDNAAAVANILKLIACTGRQTASIAQARALYLLR